MEKDQHLRAAVHWLLLRCCYLVQRLGAVMSVVDFEELQLLSGYSQASKVIRFLKENSIPYVVGSDGKPRTTHDMLNEGIRNGNEDSATEVRFPV